MGAMQPNPGGKHRRALVQSWWVGLPSRDEVDLFLPVHDYDSAKFRN
jgi:hypothetical protein